MGQGDARSVHTSRPLGDGDLRPGPDGKFGKSAVNYGAADSDRESCDKCRFFQAGTCQLVRGKISADAWCDLWTPDDAQPTNEQAMKDDLDKDGDGSIGSKSPDERSDTDGDSDDDADAKKNEEINPKKLKPTKLSDAYLADFYDLTKVKMLAGGDDAAMARSWVPVFPEGTFFHPEYGELVFDSATIPTYIDNFDKRVRHIDIAVDVDHRNEEAVGWVKQLDWRRGVGLFGLVEWNRLGMQKLGDKQYRYISAQFGDYKDEQTRDVIDNVISALTITNFPFLKRMNAIQLSEQDALRKTYKDIEKLHREAHRHEAKFPAKLHKLMDLWIEGRTLKALPTNEQRLAEGRAIVAQGHKFLAAMGPTVGDDKDGLADVKNDDDEAYKKSKKAKRAALLAQLASLDDDDEMDDDDSAKKSKKAADLDDDDEMDDDADAKKSKKAYDQDDAYGPDANMDPHKAKSAQTDRSKGANGNAPDLASKSKMSERQRGQVSLSEFREMQTQLSEARMQLRESNVEKQLAELQSGSVTFNKEILKKFRTVALKDKSRGDDLFDILNAVREDNALILLGEHGDSITPDEDGEDVLDMRVNERGDIAVGMKLSRRAKEYAEAHNLDYSDPEDRLMAFESVTNGLTEDDSKRPARARGSR